jgi:hypothetical protein
MVTAVDTCSEPFVRLRRIVGQIKGIERMLDEGMSCIDGLDQLISAPCDSPTSSPITSAGFGTLEGKGLPRAARGHARFRRGCRSRICPDRGSP